MTRQRLGDAGERLAERLLTRKGWRILERKWRGHRGEVDLVALDGATLVLIEVKTRRGEARGAAEEALDDAKVARLLGLGEEYVAAHREYEGALWRVDLIAITVARGGAIDRVTHIVNACESG